MFDELFTYKKNNYLLIEKIIYRFGLIDKRKYMSLLMIIVIFIVKTMRLSCCMTYIELNGYDSNEMATGSCN